MSDGLRRLLVETPNIDVFNGVGTHRPFPWGPAWYTGRVYQPVPHLSTPASELDNSLREGIHR